MIPEIQNEYGCSKSLFRFDSLLFSLAMLPLVLGSILVCSLCYLGNKKHVKFFMSLQMILAPFFEKLNAGTCVVFVQCTAIYLFFSYSLLLYACINADSSLLSDRFLRSYYGNCLSKRALLVSLFFFLKWEYLMHVVLLSCPMILCVTLVVAVSFSILLLIDFSFHFVFLWSIFSCLFS